MLFQLNLIQLHKIDNDKSIKNTITQTSQIEIKVRGFTKATTDITNEEFAAIVVFSNTSLADSLNTATKDVLITNENTGDKLKTLRITLNL